MIDRQERLDDLLEEYERLIAESEQHLGRMIEHQRYDDGVLLAMREHLQRNRGIAVALLIAMRDIPEIDWEHTERLAWQKHAMMQLEGVCSVLLSRQVLD